ncbi:hypothetical protein JCM17846_21540 [Iodidimonas nitroreducens]|uniref:Uncharacterized protein n=1 Tax=Iodidimonas nitroreducens TaxID=1236968 RepID=A0A5A7N802_9PROT|nr:hypothetical protein [Iodidimonas nitroreducens]GAK33528.1 hypothetical protein AQ1_01418 [alpha proteobacterium Q-1]GER04472.1 hypothetical protein JCM17846_21540 [Iodidimonas nitroreducens]
MTELISWLKQQTNDRVILGLKLLFVLLLLWIFLEMRASALEAGQRAQAARTQAMIMEDLDDPALWAVRAKAAQMDLDHWQAGAWQAPTAGIAAAMVHGALETLAKEQDVAASNVRVNPEILKVDGVDALRFDLNVRGDQAAVVRMMLALSLAMPRLIATDFNANFAARSANIRFSGIAPFQPTPASAAQPNAPQASASQASAVPKANKGGPSNGS